MVWRIHFTAEDLERIQVRPTLGPLAETVTAMSLLRCPQQPRAPYRQWRGQVKNRLTPQMTALTSLIPPGTKGVDLSMLTGTAPTLEQGVQALLAVPREQLLVEMEFTDRAHKLPAEVWAVAESGQARLQLAAAAVAAHRVLVEPYWTRIHACLHAEHVARLRALASGGPDRLLASLQSQWVRWRSPVTPGPGARHWPRWWAGTGPRCCAPSPKGARPRSSPAGWASRSRRPASTRRCCGTRG
jgi:hypothetical protein